MKSIILAAFAIGTAAAASCVNNGRYCHNNLIEKHEYPAPELAVAFEEGRDISDKAIFLCLDDKPIAIGTCEYGCNQTADGDVATAQCADQ